MPALSFIRMPYLSVMLNMEYYVLRIAYCVLRIAYFDIGSFRPQWGQHRFVIRGAVSSNQ